MKFVANWRSRRSSGSAKVVWTMDINNYWMIALTGLLDIRGISMAMGLLSLLRLNREDHLQRTKKRCSILAYDDAEQQYF
jgi:hypothetical protein